MSPVLFSTVHTAGYEIKPPPQREGFGAWVTQTFLPVARATPEEDDYFVVVWAAYPLAEAP